MTANSAHIITIEMTKMYNMVDPCSVFESMPRLAASQRMMISQQFVMPAKAGIQFASNLHKSLDSRLRENDKI
jgi:hypothetical protein